MTPKEPAAEPEWSAVAKAGSRSPPKHASVVDVATRQISVVKSAARILAIFEYFDDVQRELRVGEIAARLNYPQSSVSYLLKSLVVSGYLEYNPKTRAFLPTPRVALLGAWISQPAICDGTLIRLVQSIADETGLTVTLAARNSIFAQYIHLVEKNSGFPIHIPVGTRRLLVWSAAGFALLADEKPDTIRALVRRTNVEVVDLGKLVDAADVLRSIGQFRRQGYFLSDQLVTRGGGHISMRIPSHLAGDRTIALGVAGSSDVLVRECDAIVDVMRRHLSSVTSPAVS